MIVASQKSLGVALALSMMVPSLRAQGAPMLERIAVAPDAHGFVAGPSKLPFHPWGLNYGNGGRLMEDFWADDWDTLANDFRAMKALGANVIRIHLQFGKFMDAPDRPNRAALDRLANLLRLAEAAHLYLDLTGLASYRPADVPPWYKAMNDADRWAAQARFWSAIAEAGASSSAVFCYDLMNEPISPGAKRESGQWGSGSLFGGYDFIQFIALNPTIPREEIAVAWIRRLTAAVHSRDPSHLITVGLLPWSRQWKHLSGFLPEKVAPEIDFISVHIYPDSKKPGEALEGLQKFAVGKPIVIEETFPLSCTPQELVEFLNASRDLACGWMGHYDGDTIEALDAAERAGQLTLAKAVYRDWLRLFVRLKPDFAPGGI